MTSASPGHPPNDQSAAANYHSVLIGGLPTVLIIDKYSKLNWFPFLSRSGRGRGEGGKGEG